MTGSRSLLIAGATGYIGGLLARALRDDGRSVRCLVRDPSARRRDLERIGCEVVQGDVLEPSTLGAALDGVGSAYYLVHSMGRGGDGDFAERDAAAPSNFAGRGRGGGVERIVYLGGLGERRLRAPAQPPADGRGSRRRPASRSPTSAPRS